MLETALSYSLTQHCLVIWECCNGIEQFRNDWRAPPSPTFFSCQIMIVEVLKGLQLQYLFFQWCHGSWIPVGCLLAVAFSFVIIPFSLRLRALLQMSSIWYWLRRWDFNEIQNTSSKCMLNCNDTVVLVACEIKFLTRQYKQMHISKRAITKLVCRLVQETGWRKGWQGDKGLGSLLGLLLVCCAILQFCRSFYWFLFVLFLFFFPSFCTGA